MSMVIDYSLGINEIKFGIFKMFINYSLLYKKLNV